MKVRASAPGRCGLLGNPSDIYGGTVVSCSVPVRNEVTFTPSSTWTVNDDRRLLDAALEALPVDGAWQVELRTGVPRSSGLSGSTAMLASIVACLLLIRGEEAKLENRIEVAERVREIERHRAGIVCGYQDAYAVVHGGLNRLRFPGKHPIDSGPFGTVEPLESELPFLLITTGVERLSGSVHGPIVDRWLAGEPAVRSAIDSFTALGEAAGKWLITQNWHAFGEAMQRSHQLISDLGGSGEAIDQLVADCHSAGALGAKLAGAGMGGTVLALTQSASELEQKLRSLGYSRFMRPVIAPGLRWEIL